MVNMLFSPDGATATEIEMLFGLHTVAHLHAMHFILNGESTVNMTAATALVVYEYEFYTRFTQGLNENLKYFSNGVISGYQQYYEPRMKNNILFKMQEEGKNNGN